MFKISPVLAIAILIASVNLLAQQSSRPVRGQAQEIPKDVLALLNDSRMVAPELAVDVLIGISQSTKTASNAWRLEVLEEALRRADEVKYPVRRSVIPVKGIHVDTDAGYLSYAYDLKLDRLSLKSRILNELVKFNKDRARQVVFEMGGSLGLKPLRCAETLAYDVSDIYSTVATVANEFFSKKDIDEGIRALFVAPWLENIASPAQIPPALDLLAKFKGSDAEKFMLFGALSRAIDRNFGDDRSFTYVLLNGRTQSELARLISGIGDESLKSDLVAAYRSFLLKNLKAGRCADNEIKEASGLPSYLTATNYLFREKPLKVEDVVHSDIKEKADIVSYWRSSSSQKAGRQFRELRSARSREDLSEDEWAGMFRQALDSLDEWRPTDDESESDVFNQKAVLLRILYESVPNGKPRDTLTDTFVNLLDNSPMQKHSIIEWLFHVRWLAAEEPVRFAAAVQSTNNANLRFIVYSAKIAGL